MARRLNENHRKLHQLIKKYPNRSNLFYHEKAKISYTLSQNYISTLLHAGLIKVNGKEKKMQLYVVTDLDFDEIKQNYVRTHKKREFSPVLIPTEVPDLLMRSVSTYELTDEQWNYIKANPTLSRREISKNLDIPRTLLLAAIERRKERERGKKS